MRIGQLAARAQVSPDTVRYYERLGLLRSPPRTSNRYRVYGEEALEDLRFIRKAQALGLKLRDVREVLEIAAGGRAPCDHVRSTLEARLAEVDERFAALRALRATLEDALSRLDRTPARAGCRCSMIESL